MKKTLFYLLVIALVMVMGCKGTHTEDTEIFKNKYAPDPNDPENQPRPGEVELCTILTSVTYKEDSSIFSDDLTALPRNFKSIGYRSKRHGTVHYDEYHHPIEQSTMVFVLKTETEYDSAQVEWKKFKKDNGLN